MLVLKRPLSITELESSHDLTDNRIKEGNVIGGSTNGSGKNLVFVVVDDDGKFLLGSPGCT